MREPGQHRLHDHEPRDGQRDPVDGDAVVPRAGRLDQVADQPRRGQPGRPRRARAGPAPRPAARGCRRTSVRAYRRDLGGVGDGQRPSLLIGVLLLGLTRGRVARARRPAARGACPRRPPGRPRTKTTWSARSSTSGLVVQTTVVRPVPGRAQPVRDPGLGVRVHRAGRLDQHQHRRVGEQRPGQPQPLPLAAGELPAALGHHGVQPVGQRLDDVRRRWPRRSAVDDRARSAACVAGSSSVAQRPGEQRASLSATRIRSPHRRHGRRSASGTPPQRDVAVGVPAEPVGDRRRVLGLGGDDRGEPAGRGSPRPDCGSTSSPRPVGRASPGRPGRPAPGSSASTPDHPPGGDVAPDQLVGRLGQRAQREHQERRVAVEGDQLARR